MASCVVVVGGGGGDGGADGGFTIPCKNYVIITCFHVAQKPNSGPGLLILKVYISDTIRHTHALGRTPQLVAEADITQHTTTTRDENPCFQRDSHPRSRK